jgi:hypothetical protein
MIEEIERRIEKKGKEGIIEQVCSIFNNLMKDDKKVSKTERIQNTQIFQNKLIVANAYLDPPDGYNNVGLDAKELKQPIHTRRREDFLSILKCEFQELPN